MLLLAFAVASTLGTHPPTARAGCPGAVSTIDIDQCLGQQRDAATRVLDRYRSAARAKLVREDPDDAGLPVAFDAAQEAWTRYAKLQCDAVLHLWAGGSIRGAMTLECQIRATQFRTHDLWRDWLTFQDSTPPELPEPVVATGS